MIDLRRLPAGSAALLVGGVIAMFALAAVFATRGYEERLEGVRHSVDVQRRLTTVLSAMQDAETGQRGFLLTGQAAYLGPYNSAVARVEAEVTGLEAEVIDDPDQVRSVRMLRPMIQGKLTELNRTIAMAQARDADTALQMVRSDYGREQMDSIRRVIGAMSERETATLVERTAASRRFSYGLFGLLSLLAMGTLLSLLVWLGQARRNEEAAQAAHDTLVATNDQLQREAQERAHAEAQVRQLQKMEALGQLTGGVAHDFNNMLAVIISNIDMARRHKGNPEKLEARLGGALEGATKAANLTRRLLAFSRQQPLEPRVVDLNALVAGMSDMLLRTLGAEVKIETVLAGGLWPAYADPTQLESALLNLAVNARDAMPNGGRLTVETANAHLDDAYAAQHPGVTAGQYVMVSVTDTGQGMTPEVLTKAFDPFFTTKPAGKGTGLGLSQIYGFARQTGGQARICSEVGQGTTVKLYLPRDQRGERPAAPEAMTEGEVTPVGAPGRIILVVEDEDALRAVSVETLRELGYTVRHAHDGPAALAVLQEIGSVDLLFTDIIMPGMNGRELADAAVKLQPNLKVLYTTGYTRTAVVNNGVVDAGVSLLSKPFTVEQLATRVYAALRED